MFSTIIITVAVLVSFSYCQFAVSQTGDVHLLNANSLNVTSKILINGIDPFAISNLVTPKIRSLQILSVYPINSRRYQKFDNPSLAIQDAEMFTLNGTAHLLFSTSNAIKNTTIWRWDSFYGKFSFLQNLDLTNGWGDDVNYFPVGGFYFLTQSYSTSDMLGFNTLWRYNNNTGYFTQYQTLTNTWVQHWEFCQMGSVGFLFGAAPSTTSLLYRYNGTHFVPHSSQPFAQSLSAKCIVTSSGITYLAIGQLVPTPGVRLYSYDAGTFTPFGSLLSNTYPYEITFVYSGNYNLMGVVNRDQGAPTIYSIVANSTITAISSPVPFVMGTNFYDDVELFTIASDIYLIVSDFSTPPVGNILYKFNTRIQRWDRITTFAIDDPSLDQTAYQPSTCFRYGEFNNQGWLFGCLSGNAFLYQLIPL